MMLRIYSALVLALCLILVAPPAAARQIVGQARVIDGDTIEVAGQRIRLAVVDAPELRQSCDVNGKSVACGASARYRLEALLTGQVVRCDHRGAFSHRRAVADCAVAGLSLTRRLLSEGVGRIDDRFLHEWPDHASGWIEAEAEARAARRGLWQGHAVSPQVFRGAAGLRPATARVIRAGLSDPETSP